MRSVLYGLCLLMAIAPALAKQTKPEEPIYKIEKDVKPPRPISTPKPDFSADAKRGKVDGVVVVNGYVGTDGKFHDAKILHLIGDSGLEGKVREAVGKWTFHPRTRDDKPVNCKMNMEKCLTSSNSPPSSRCVSRPRDVKGLWTIQYRARRWPGPRLQMA